MRSRYFAEQHPVLAFFGLAVVWSYVYWQVLFTISPVDPLKGPGPQHLFLAAVGGSPSLFGVLVVWLSDGVQGLRALFSRLGRWRVGSLWFAAAFLLFPSLNAITYLLYPQLGGRAYPLTIANLAMGLAIGIMSSLFEELGWRGFALPALQKRFSPLVSSLIVGLGWGLWHLRLNTTMMSEWDTVAILSQIFSAWGPFGLTAISVLMAWVYNSARNSLLLTVLLHFSLTSSFFLFGPPPSAGSAEFLRFHLITLAVMWSVAFAAVTLNRSHWLSRNEN